MTLKPNFSIHAILVTSLLLVGCTASGDRYPSLAQTDAERVYGTLSVAGSTDAETTPTAPDEPNPDLDQRLASLVQEADDAHAAFTAMAPNVAVTVEQAMGLGVESNEWAAAQVQLADLAAYRSATLKALGDLDLIEAQAATSFVPTDKISAAQTRINSLMMQQNVMLDSFYRMLKP